MKLQNKQLKELFFIICVLQAGTVYSVPTVDMLSPTSGQADPHTQKLWELSVKQIHVCI